MKYPVLSTSDAGKLIELMRKGEAPNPASFAKTVGSGPRLAEELIISAANRVREIQAKFPAVLKYKDKNGGEFEAAAGEALHKALNIPPEVSGDDGFWRYLAVAHLFEVVVWRHPSKVPGEFTNLANFGLGSLWDNLVARMWYRFEVARLPDEDDPYVLCRLGDQDLWRSHILRIRFGAARHMVKTLLSFQYPDRDTNKPRLPMSSKADSGIRLFIKRLQRLHATTSFEILTEEESLAIMADLAKDLLPQSHATQS